MANYKFFEKNIINSNTAFTLTTANTSLTNYLYDNDLSVQLNSIASSDTVAEIWNLTFDGAQGFDTVFVGNHNIKTGNLKYWSATAYVDFTPAIAWVANSTTNNFYEVASVSTSKLQLTMSTTIAANDQKKVGQLRVLSEVGEVVNNPKSADPIWGEKSKNFTTDDNSSVYVYFGDKYSAKLKFKNAKADDEELFRNLKDLRQSFYVYPSGGGTDYTQEGFRVQDMYLVNYVNDFKYKLSDNRLLNGIDIDLDLKGAY